MPSLQAKTRVRKMALVIPVDSVGLVLLRKTRRLCVICEMLIARGPARRTSDIRNLRSQLRLSQSQFAAAARRLADICARQGGPDRAAELIVALDRLPRQGVSTQAIGSIAAPVVATCQQGA